MKLQVFFGCSLLKKALSEKVSIKIKEWCHRFEKERWRFFSDQ